jgi:hypothetical protein
MLHLEHDIHIVNLEVSIMENIKLCYRGTEYAYTPTRLEQMGGKTIEQYRVGQYRGAVWRLPYRKLILPPQPTVILKYRGSFYATPSPVAMNISQRVWQRSQPFAAPLPMHH